MNQTTLLTQRRSFLIAATICLAQLPLSLFAQNSAEKPNILFIIADDQAPDTIGKYGHQVSTPNLDKLFSRGTRFTNVYNMGGWNGAICTASRTMLMTGQSVWDAHTLALHWQEQKTATKSRHYADPKDHPSVPVWTRELKKSGYSTYFSGKWHVNLDASKTFDYVSNVRPGMPRATKAWYNRPQGPNDKNWLPWDKSQGGFWKGGIHWSEVLANDAEGFIEQAGKSQDPFFMYLAFNAPHDPRQAPKEYVDKYPAGKMKLPENYQANFHLHGKAYKPELRDELTAPFPRSKYAVQVARSEYYAMIEHMDAQIGRIFEALEKTGKADNTYIIFTADHGLAVGRHGMMGKQNMYEHSLKVPFVISGPSIAKGKEIENRIYLQDLMPTTLELAGRTPPKNMVYKSLVPLLKGSTKTFRSSIYGCYSSTNEDKVRSHYQRMILVGDYKLITYPYAYEIELFNLKEDPWEMNDLSKKPEYQAKIHELQKELRKRQVEYNDPLLKG